MYVGPWQEYKLMRVIEDLRGELSKQQELLQQQQPAQQATVRIPTSTTPTLPPVASASTVYDLSPAASVAPQMVTRKEKERQDAQQRVRPPYRVYNTLPSDASAKGRCVTCHHSDAEAGGSTNPVGVNSYADYVIRDIKAPTYGRNEEQLLMQMGLPFIGSAAPTTTATTDGHGVQRALQQHPYVKDLSRRAPLDTEAVSARAGQRFYKRVMEGGVPLGSAQHQPYRAAGSTAGGVADNMEDKRRKKLVERRLRLQALYRAGDGGGGGGEDDLLEGEESDEDDLPLSQQQQQLQQPEEEEGEITRRFSNDTAMGEGNIYASPVPRPAATYDSVPSPPPPPATTNVTTSLEDIFKKAKPPTPKSIEADDVGGLLDWANQLNDDWMQDM